MDTVLGTLSKKMEFPCQPIQFLRDEILHYSMIAYSCASSKHLQTRRFLDTLQGYLMDIQRILVSIHLEANARPAPFVDHAGILRDSKTGRPINGHVDGDSGQDSDDEDLMRTSQSNVSNI
jgi:hypothetical protein